MRDAGKPIEAKPAPEHVPPGGRQSGTVPRNGPPLHLSAQPVSQMVVGDGPPYSY